MAPLPFENTKTPFPDIEFELHLEKMAFSDHLEHVKSLVLNIMALVSQQVHHHLKVFFILEACMEHGGENERVEQKD